MISNQEILSQTKAYIKQAFHQEGTGHDYYHIERVVINAQKILQSEIADPYLVELAAWLHDLGDHKLHQGIDRSQELINNFLHSLNVAQETIDKIVEIISQVSFSKGNTPTTIEAKIVQDADRLDAIGAIGIARCFAYGGSQHRIIYSPEDSEKTLSSVQHFDDKLFKLKDLMHTHTAKTIAEHRHEFMKTYIQELMNEVTPSEGETSI